MVAYVAHFQRKIRGEGMLQVEGPGIDVRSLQVWIDAHHAARIVEAIQRRRGEDGARDARDCGIPVDPTIVPLINT